MADPQYVEQVQSNIPAWMQPYAAQLLGSVFGGVDPTTGKFVPGLVGQGYQPYAKPKLDAQGKPVLDAQGRPVMEGIQRVAEFTPLQQQAFNRLAGMQTSPELTQAADIARGVGADASRLSQYTSAAERNFYDSPAFREMQTQFERVGAGPSTQFQMQGPKDVTAQQLERFQMQGPADVRAPSDYERVQQQALRDYQMQGPRDITAREYGPLSMGPAERVGIGALQQYQMGPAERVGAERFGLGSMREYMSPYMQGVVEAQKRGAVSDYMRQLPGLGAAAARAGAKGGTREALMQSEAQRGLAERLGDIESQGLQQAYQQAASQFGQDRAAMMQAALANQQAGLTTGQQNLAALLGVQQLGTQSGLQAALANQAAGLTVGQQNLAAEQARQQFLSQQSLEAQRLNQAAGLTTEQQNLAARLQTQGLSAQQAMEAARLNQAAGLQTGQMGLQAALANQQAGLTTGQQNLAALLQTQGLSAQQAMQAALANQQAQQATGQTNLQALINQSQFGASQGLQAQQMNQAAQLQAQQQALAQLAQANQFSQQNAAQRAQYGLAGANLAEQSRQFGAGLGLQGLQQRLAAAGALGGLGQQRYGQEMGITQGQLGAGGQQQALNQQLLNLQYQDFINQQQFPYKQAEFAMGILRGLPATGQTSTFYQQPASIFNQVAGAGMMGIGGLFGGMGQTT